MADVTIEGTANAANWRAWQRNVVWTSATNGYVFYIDNSADAIYRKTTNAGVSWGAKVTIKAGTISCGGIWYDKWTPGDSGTKIYVVYLDTATDDVMFRDLDTSSDTLGTERTVFAGATFAGTIAGGWDARSVGIVKAVGGNLYCKFNPDTGVEVGFYRSTDGGVNWTSRANVAGVGLALLLPANTSDSNDVVALIYPMAASTAAKLAIYDDSGNAWSTYDVFTPAGFDVNYAQQAASIRHSDKHIIWVCWNDIDSATADLLCYEINANSETAGSGMVTAKTNISSNFSEYAQCAVMIDQARDVIWVAFLIGSPWATDADVYMMLSADGGTTWAVSDKVNTTTDDMRAVWLDLGSSVTDAPVAPIYQNDDLDDIYVNAVNRVLRPYTRMASLGNGALTVDWALISDDRPAGLIATNSTGFTWHIQHDDSVTDRQADINTGGSLAIGGSLAVTINDALYSTQIIPA